MIMIYNSVLEITVSFLGIHKWETDIILGSHQPFIFSFWEARIYFFYLTPSKRNKKIKGKKILKNTIQKLLLFKYERSTAIIHGRMHEIQILAWVLPNMDFYYGFSSEVHGGFFSFLQSQLSFSLLLYIVF